MNKTRFAGIAAGVILLFGAGVATASIPATNGTINGCYKTSDGKLRVIDSDATCSSGETPINWSQTGPKGDAGPAGPQGEAGASYELGQSIAESTTTSIPFGGNAANVVATCPEGKVSTGGGYITSSPYPVIRKTLPTGTGWEVTAINTSDSQNTNLQVFAVCVNSS